jgi:pectin methylesterase-like acyl-CoA thioesterase
MVKHRGRHYFKNCFIQGDMDFIFGDGLSIYKDSTKTYHMTCTLKTKSLLTSSQSAISNPTSINVKKDCLLVLHSTLLCKSN